MAKCWEQQFPWDLSTCISHHGQKAMFWSAGWWIFLRGCLTREFCWCSQTGRKLPLEAVKIWMCPSVGTGARCWRSFCRWPKRPQNWMAGSTKNEKILGVKSVKSPEMLQTSRDMQGIKWWGRRYGGFLWGCSNSWMVWNMLIRNAWFGVIPLTLETSKSMIFWDDHEHIWSFKDWFWIHLCKSSWGHHVV